METPSYSPETIRSLIVEYRRLGLHRPVRPGPWDPGDVFTLEVRGVAPARPARVRLRVERFVGGGFAGQVYRVSLLSVDAPEGSIPGLEPGGVAAMKIHVPPSGFARVFREALYRIGFQAPFPYRGNPAAVRAGALWQKLLRRAARVRLGDERAVTDVFATFTDERLGSLGEILEWVDGRTWLLEADDRLFARWRWKPGRDGSALGSPEYRAKRRFMADLVALLHEVGAPELARQHAWGTWKSQPNTLKRLEAGEGPGEGLAAVDFRAGLALLPLLPMSPADVRLIGGGLRRGSPVQFDRGDPGKLRRFAEDHPDEFADLGEALEELTVADREYRESQVDLTHHHVRLLVAPRIWSRVRAAAVTGWRIRGWIDDRAAATFRRFLPGFLLFAVLGLLAPAGLAAAVAAVVRGARGGWGFLPTAGAAVGLALVPAFFGRVLRRLLGRADHRRHYGSLLTSPAYLLRALRGRNAERLMHWHRAGRVNAARTKVLLARPWHLLWHLPLSLLPVWLHRLLTDAAWAKERLAYLFVRPVRLYVNAAAREAWMREMVAEGRKKHMLTEDEAGGILSRIGEPFIQKYLKCLAVHLCTLPVTQIVSVAVALWYVRAHPELSWEKAWTHAGLILAAFQVTPISPGSLVRGLYTLSLVIRERNFRDYHVAVFLSFFKYVGYLAFPIQMACRYPALARFMAGFWATQAVHVVPVFGERGALLEHAAFDLVYNYPLTLRRRMRERAEHRAALPPRRWHAVPAAMLGAALLLGMEHLWWGAHGTFPTLRELWIPVVLVPAFLGGTAISLARGTPLGGRIALAALAGGSAGILYGALRVVLHASAPGLSAAARGGGWCFLLFGLLAVVSALLLEFHLPPPRRSREAAPGAGPAE